jgi:hypothetical protein
MLRPERRERWGGSKQAITGVAFFQRVTFRGWNCLTFND